MVEEAELEEVEVRADGSVAAALRANGRRGSICIAPCGTEAVLEVGEGGSRAVRTRFARLEDRAALAAVMEIRNRATRSQPYLSCATISPGTEVLHTVAPIRASWILSPRAAAQGRKSDGSLVLRAELEGGMSLSPCTISLAPHRATYIARYLCQIPSEGRDAALIAQRLAASQLQQQQRRQPRLQEAEDLPACVWVEHEALVEEAHPCFRDVVAFLLCRDEEGASSPSSPSSTSSSPPSSLERHISTPLPVAQPHDCTHHVHAAGWDAGLGSPVAPETRVRVEVRSGLVYRVGTRGMVHVTSFAPQLHLRVGRDAYECWRPGMTVLHRAHRLVLEAKLLGGLNIHTNASSTPDFVVLPGGERFGTSHAVSVALRLLAASSSGWEERGEDASANPSVLRTDCVEGGAVFRLLASGNVEADMGHLQLTLQADEHSCTVWDMLANTSRTLPLPHPGLHEREISAALEYKDWAMHLLDSGTSQEPQEDMETLDVQQHLIKLRMLLLQSGEEVGPQELGLKW